MIAAGETLATEMTRADHYVYSVAPTTRSDVVYKLYRPRISVLAIGNAIAKPNLDEKSVLKTIC